MVVTAQITMTGSAVQFSTAGVPCRAIFIQNNSTHSVRVGDANVTTTRGALLASGSPGGSLYSGPFVVYATNLFDWWAIGTNGDLLDVVYIT